MLQTSLLTKLQAMDAFFELVSRHPAADLRRRALDLTRNVKTSVCRLLRGLRQYSIH